MPARTVLENPVKRSYTIESEQADRIEAAIARRQGTSASDIVRQALDFFLASYITPDGTIITPDAREGR